MTLKLPFSLHNSHISPLLLLLLVGLILISSINMACEISELREFFYKFNAEGSLKLTGELTDPNRIEQISQDKVIISPHLLYLD